MIEMFSYTTCEKAVEVLVIDLDLLLMRRTMLSLQQATAHYATHTHIARNVAASTLAECRKHGRK